MYLEENQQVKFKVFNEGASFFFDANYLDRYESEFVGELFSNYSTAINKLKEKQLKHLPSIELINAKCKQFNDGFYAAIELALFNGVKGFLKSKKEFLQQVLIKLNQFDSENSFEVLALNEAILYISIGLSFLDEKLEVPGHLKDGFLKRRQKFELNEIKSKPIGFYSWNEYLQKIFVSDRFFQSKLKVSNKLEIGAAILISKVISEEKELLKNHELIIETYKKLTNPISMFSVEHFYPLVPKKLDEKSVEEFYGKLKLTDAFKEFFEKKASFSNPMQEIGFALFPFSYSKETDLFNKLQASKDLMNSLIKAIKLNQISLKPSKKSGFYDFQQFALEPLVLPEKTLEAQKIEFSKEYLKRLEEAFKTILAKTRETHVKQLEMSKGEEKIDFKPEPEKIIKIFVSPKFSLEPLPSHFFRLAQAYEFLEKELKKLFPENFLNELNRLKENTSVSNFSLLKELVFMKELLYGLYLLSFKELGVNKSFGKEEENTRLINQAMKWLNELEKDEDLKLDSRVIVPIQLNEGYMESEKEIVCWAPLGVTPIKVESYHKTPPKIEVIEKPLNAEVSFEFVKASFYALVDVFAEVTLNTTPLNREEFRTLCNEKKSVKEIIKALEERK